MQVDRDLVVERIRRELFERVLPLVERQRRPLAITAGPTPHDQAPFEVGSRWGPPWGTTWFTFRGEIPDEWSGRRVEAAIDLGFHPDAAGFQCEGLVVEGPGRPVQGIHPRRTKLGVAAEPGPVTIRLEAASNPTFIQFAPSALGSLDTAGDRPLYRFRRAELLLVDGEAEALAHDIDVLAGLMEAMSDGDQRRDRFRHTITGALDHLPDVARMRSMLRPLLDMPAPGSAHRIVATGHAHIDTAWLWPIGETVRKCTRTFASAVRLMDEYPEYRFSCSQAQQYAWIEEHQPELFEQIAVKVGGGQWIPVGGMWVEADMNLPSGESLARQIVHGQRWFESRFGRRCTEVWIPDVFGYPASMPQLYAAGGMHRFVTQKLSWNTTNRFPHHTFWWEGLDGTRVLTHFPPVDTYNAEITPQEVTQSVERFREAALVRLVVDAVRPRRRWWRADPRDAGTGAPDDRPRRCTASVDRLTGRVLHARRARGLRRRPGAGVAWRAVLRDPSRHAHQPTSHEGRQPSLRAVVARGRAVVGHCRPSCRRRPPVARGVDAAVP